MMAPERIPVSVADFVCYTLEQKLFQVRKCLTLRAGKLLVNTRILETRL